MTLSVGMSLAVIAVLAAVTLFTRVLPCVFFSDVARAPKFIVYLGRALPPAMIGMLVVYCLKGVDLCASPFGLPEAIAVCATVALHVWRRNNLISIFGATALYMVLIQLVF